MRAIKLRRPRHNSPTPNSSLADLQAKQTDRGMVVTLGDVLFDTGQATLKPGANLAMNRLGTFLSANPQTKILVEGHTDSRGSDEYNDALVGTAGSCGRDRVGVAGRSGSTRCRLWAVARPTRWPAMTPPRAGSKTGASRSCSAMRRAGSRKVRGHCSVNGSEGDPASGSPATRSPGLPAREARGSGTSLWPRTGPASWALSGSAEPFPRRSPFRRGGNPPPVTASSAGTW